ncbi:MAG: hypothetical protein WBK43_04930 [Prolixibacteraceae bacterium]|nr:hypothetical protein [Prolixibacteraceae bacterium]HOF55435.1 hypothetical protein [Prolixibacteraceae bacterium]HOS00097.1 hypothetical protein [Prolixibacteraceae bacterium]HPI35295.1 hypothetical protein [Prolixibacteraceae bacterium]HPL45431.1 hypothetical protein [Prolixibacteraceae bacterium]
MNAWSLLMAKPVLKPVEFIPLFRDLLPRQRYDGKFQFRRAKSLRISPETSNNK